MGKQGMSLKVGSGSNQGLTLLKHACLGKGQATQVCPVEINSSSQGSPCTIRQLDLSECPSE